MNKSLLLKKVIELIFISLIFLTTFLIYMIALNEFNIMSITLYGLLYLFFLLLFYRIYSVSIFNYLHKINIFKLILLTLSVNLVVVISLLVFKSYTDKALLIMGAKVVIDTILIRIFFMYNFHLHKNTFIKRTVVIGEKRDLDIFLNESKLLEQKYIDFKYFVDTIRLEYIDENILELLDNIDIIYILSSVNINVKNDIIDYCNENQKICFLIPNHNEISVQKSKTLTSNNILMFKVDKFGLSLEERFVKRMMDFIISFLGLLILSPLLLLISFIIYMNDKSNPLFIQDRITKDGKEFKLIKFRTMIPNAEKNTGPVLSSENDDRITRLGSLLRKTRLDEVPQLINVFMGDMSIVGPRPERKVFVDKFSNEEKTYNYRHRVKSGITGYAQISSKYNTSYINKLKFDLHYIKNYSIFLDLKIIIHTFFIVFKFDAASGVVVHKNNYILEKGNLNVSIYKIESVDKKL